MPLFFWFDHFLEAKAEILEKIVVFWEIWRHQKDILKLTDLYLLENNMYGRNSDRNILAEANL